MRRDWKDVSERPDDIAPEDKDRSFFLGDDSKDWRLPIAPAIGSFILCSSTISHPDTINNSGLPTRLIDAILLSVRNTQDLFLGFTAPLRLPKGSDLFAYWPDWEFDRFINPRGQNLFPSKERTAARFLAFGGLLTWIQPDMLELIPTAGLCDLPPTVEGLSVQCVPSGARQLLDAHELQVVEDFVWAQVGLRESLNLDLYIIPASGRLFHGRDLSQLRNLMLHNVAVSPKMSLEGCYRPHMIPGFDDFMIELSRSMVTTMPGLKTVRISFRPFHGPITYSRRP